MNGSDRTDVETEPRSTSLQSSAGFAVLVGAAGSLACTLFAGRHNHSMVLVTIFAVWVLSPFAGMYASNRVSRRASGRSRDSLHAASVILSICSLAIYAVEAIHPPLHNTAWAFLMVPGVMWLIIGIDFLIAARISRRR
ncbi:MAG TPA: hypothetical protein VG225_15755 [Terracidiphilus sp.]|jgi:tryptophan-rich sensory protein|nr:hypothetical protein [Terracidiphilus sp.]